MMGWMIGGGVALFNFILASVFAYRIGVHRVRHGGGRNEWCSHWACSGGFPVATLALLLGPVFVPIILFSGWLTLLKNIGYNRNLPPKNGNPNGRVSE